MTWNRNHAHAYTRTKKTCMQIERSQPPSQSSPLVGRAQILIRIEKPSKHSHERMNRPTRTKQDSGNQQGLSSSPKRVLSQAPLRLTKKLSTDVETLRTLMDCVDADAKPPQHKRGVLADTSKKPAGQNMPEPADATTCCAALGDGILAYGLESGIGTAVFWAASLYILFGMDAYFLVQRDPSGDATILAISTACMGIFFTEIILRSAVQVRGKVGGPQQPAFSLLLALYW
jgi:hypothetical protein